MKQVLIVGGGIAGASAAYFAAQSGHPVTLLDAAEGRASDVPAALLNPVRGQSGSVDEQMLKGLRQTWSLIAELEQRGQIIPHGQTGVLRPVPDERTRTKWQARLPESLPHHWHEAAGLPLSEQTPHWHSVLSIPEGGWVSGAALVRALKAASGARLLSGRAVSVSARSAVLDSGATLSADVVVQCGGSLGAAVSNAALSGAAHTHRAGSLLLLSAAPPVPLSFGAYLSPAAVGGVLGATYEAPTDSHASALALGLPLPSLNWLLTRGAALSDLRGVNVTGRWTGVRLSPLSAERDAAGVWHLTGLGSKGFVLGPLLAREWAQRALAE